jgi:hypothetical protein
MHPTQPINRYLFHEFGFDIDRDGCLVDEALVTNSWPFELDYVGTITQPELSQMVFTFQYGVTPYYALWGSPSSTYPCAGMSLEHLQRQAHGSAWIQQYDPINLASSRIGDPTIPPTVMRRAAIESLAIHACSHLFRFRIVEGLFLRRIQHYLAVVEDEEVHQTFVLGTMIAAQPVGFAEAAAWRRLAVHIGELLEAGHLSDKELGLV